MAPLLAFGHACEFLTAKLDVREGTVHLEVTADYGGNPMIEDEASAREAVRTVLQVVANNRQSALEELAPLRFERRRQWDAATPASFSPPPDGQEHQLLTAVWQWRTGAADVAFAVPKGSPNDVLLWTTAKHLPGKQVQWMLLITGESSPSIAIPNVAPGKRWWWLLVSFALIAAVFLARRTRVRLSQRNAAES